jgi:hypothetical protein
MIGSGEAVFRIVYTSTLDPAIGSAEVEAIVRDAQAHNERHAITGVWLMHGRDCLSALEGPPEAVRQLAERIWDDRRHAQFRLRDMKAVEYRLFEGRPLQFLDATTADPEDWSADPGLRWLCSFAGGVETFCERGLPEEPAADS